MNVRIKPLDWHGMGFFYTAYTILGDYFVSGLDGKWRWYFEDEDPILEGKCEGSEEAAKAAAQADYEARILEALEFIEPDR